MEISNVEREKAAILKGHADQLERDTVRATVEVAPKASFTPNSEKPAPKETQQPAQKIEEKPAAPVEKPAATTENTNAMGPIENPAAKQSMTQKKNGDFDLGTTTAQSHLSLKERKNLLKTQKSHNDQQIAYLKL